MGTMVTAETNGRGSGIENAPYRPMRTRARFMRPDNNEGGRRMETEKVEDEPTPALAEITKVLEKFPDGATRAELHKALGQMRGKRGKAMTPNVLSMRLQRAQEKGLVVRHGDGGKNTTKWRLAQVELPPEPGEVTPTQLELISPTKPIVEMMTEPETAWLHAFLDRLGCPPAPPGEGLGWRMGHAEAYGLSDTPRKRS